MKTTRYWRERRLAAEAEIEADHQKAVFSLIFGITFLLFCAMVSIGWY